MCVTLLHYFAALRILSTRYLLRLWCAYSGPLLLCPGMCHPLRWWEPRAPGSHQHRMHCEHALPQADHTAVVAPQHASLRTLCVCMCVSQA